MVKNIKLLTGTAVPLLSRDMDRSYLAETVSRMAGFLLLGNSSSTTAPALSYYRPSMDISVTAPCVTLLPYVLYICIALISYIHVTMQNLHFHRPWWSDAAAEPPWKADICSSAIAPR